MIKVLMIVVAVVCISYNSSVRADEIVGLDGVNPKEAAKLEKLVPFMVEVSNRIEAKIPQQYMNVDPAECFRVARDQLHQLTSSGSCLTSACLPLLSKKRRQIEAYELFLALEDAIKHCDLNTYEVLLKNKFICDRSDPYEVAGKVLRRSLELHAELCRPRHKETFAQRAKNFHEVSYVRAERALFNLTIADFAYSDEDILYKTDYDFDLVGMRKPKFSGQYVWRSREKIVKNIFEQVKDNPTINELRNSKERLQKYSGALKTIFDEYLFNPCDVYNKALSDLMYMARLDATPRDGKAQKEFIYGDEKFHRAMVTNRLCESLLEEREKLYWPLSNILNKLVRPSTWRFAEWD